MKFCKNLMILTPSKAGTDTEIIFRVGAYDKNLINKNENSLSFICHS